MTSAYLLPLFLGTVGLVACSTPPPTGPDVLALPPAGKNLVQFRQEDAGCRAYAQQQTDNADPQRAQNRSTAMGAVAGGGVGAAAGAVAGAAAGNAGAGAAIGAGSGLPAGSTIGARDAPSSPAALQQRYDVTYAQCMAARGNTIQPMIFGWVYRPYPYAYPDGAYYSPGIAPPLTLGFLGLHGFHHHGFHHRESFHHDFDGGFHRGFHGGFHRG